MCPVLEKRKRKRPHPQPQYGIMTAVFYILEAIVAGHGYKRTDAHMFFKWKIEMKQE